MINQDDKPGHGYQLKEGGDESYRIVDANLSSSHNHFMLGQITEWFYRDLAGIDGDLTGAGGSRRSCFVRSPLVISLWVEAGDESIHGPIAVRWEHDGERFVLKATIPANTTATVSCPRAQTRQCGKAARLPNSDRREIPSPRRRPRRVCRRVGKLHLRITVRSFMKLSSPLIPVLLLMLVAAATATPQDALRIDGPEQGKLDLSLPDGGLPLAVGVWNIEVFRATRTAPGLADGKGWADNHHVDMACWKGRIDASCISREKDEDVWPWHELYSTSADGEHWSAPGELFPQVSPPRCGCISFWRPMAGCWQLPDCGWD